MTYPDLKNKVSQLLEYPSKDIFETLTEICKVLKAGISYYDWVGFYFANPEAQTCLLYTSPSPRDRTRSRMPSSA